jgi:hypothetical protein
MGGSYKGITHGLQPCNASSTLAPSTMFGSGTRRQSAGLKSQWIRFNSVPSHHFGEWPSWLKARALEHEIGSSNLPSPTKVIYKETIVTNELISMNHVEDRLTAQDDPGIWKEILAALGEEFLQRYRAERGEKESWFLRIGACSHWVRPKQSRWIAAGGFALPIGYKGAAGWSNGLPEFDWW